MAMEGMDVDAVEAIGGKLAGQADAIGHAISTIEGLVFKVENFWHGQDAVIFFDDWLGIYKPAMLASQRSISELALAATRNAKQQRETSAT